MYYTNLATFLVLEVFPISSLIYYNFKIYKAMRLSFTNVVGQGAAQYSRNKQENSLVRVMIGIVVVFIICHSLRGPVYIYILVKLQAVHDCQNTGSVPYLGPVWFYLLLAVNYVLLGLNSSVNMIIYCCINSNFRRHLLSIVMTLPWRGTSTRFTSVSTRES
jgi:hypothetical protein